jgi:hypothetical protein
VAPIVKSIVPESPMALRLFSRSSLVLLLLCALVVAQKPMRLLVQGFASVIIETVERADEATPSSVVVVTPSTLASRVVVRATAVPVAGAVTAHPHHPSILRI